MTSLAGVWFRCDPCMWKCLLFHMKGCSVCVSDSRLCCYLDDLGKYLTSVNLNVLLCELLSNFRGSQYGLDKGIITTDFDF